MTTVLARYNELLAAPRKLAQIVNSMDYRTPNEWTPEERALITLVGVVFGNLDQSDRNA